jgi:hypothetical protein
VAIISLHLIGIDSVPDMNGKAELTIAANIGNIQISA